MNRTRTTVDEHVNGPGSAILLAPAVPGAPAIPGLQFRHYSGHADLPGMVEAINAAHEQDRLDWFVTRESLAADYDHPAGFEPSRDVLLALIGERIVAVASVSFSVRDDEDTYELWCDVHPEFRRRGLGRALLAYNENHVRTLAATRPTGGTRWFMSWGGDDAIGTLRLFEQQDYEPIRWFFVMLNEDLAATPDAALPEGIELRPIRPENHRQVFDAEAEAFQDHWGRREWGDDVFEWLFASPEIDTSMWQVAWDGEEVAGVVSVWIYPAENERMGVRRGWLEHVSVRRGWRRRGLARALVASAMSVLHERGMTQAALGVDSQNASGALGLYERLGFRQIQRGTTYRKAF